MRKASKASAIEQAILDVGFRHSITRRFDILRDTSATAAIEFGMVGVLIILLVVETMQAGLYFYTAASLEFATNKAARQILTGAVSSQGLTAAQFRTQVLCPLLPAAMSCSSVITNLRTVAEDVYPNGFYAFVKTDQSGINQPTMDNTQTSFCPGAAGAYVYLQVFYAMPVVSPTWKIVASTLWNGSAVHFVGAASAFENEPFQGNTAPGGC